MDDRVLVKQARGGDSTAFDELMRRHVRRIFRVAFKIVGNREDAEDVVQGTFTRAHQHLRSLRDRESFAGWLNRIAVRLCIDHERARKARPHWVPMDSDQLNLEPSIQERRTPTREAAQRDLMQLVQKEIQDLAPRLRGALVLRVMEGLSYPEVAEALGTSVQSARMYVFEARQALAHRMASEWEGDVR